MGALAALAAAGLAAAVGRPPPRTFLWNGTALLDTLHLSQTPAAPPNLRVALKGLTADAAAAAALARAPSVMDKPLTPESGDKHDYMSLGSYWWPCTAACNATLFPVRARHPTLRTRWPHDPRPLSH